MTAADEIAAWTAANAKTSAVYRYERFLADATPAERESVKNATYYASRRARKDKP